MKNKLLLVVSIGYLGILTGCSGIKCGYPTDCWKAYFKETSCGTYTHSPCEKICNKCTFNDLSCQECWVCVNQDGCGFSNIKMCNQDRNGRCTSR